MRTLAPHRIFILLLILWASWSHAAVSINLPLDDPAYPLLDKLVHSGLTFRNALTIKPITRLYAARLIAEAIQQRRQEWQTTPQPFVDEILQYLAGRFKAELRQIGFFYQPLRPGPLILTPLAELKLDMFGAYQLFVQRDSSGLTDNLQGVFSLQEGFIPGNDFSMRWRAASWATLWQRLAVYSEPELIVRSDPLLGDAFDGNLYKGYVKVDYANVELALGRDTLWWGPATQGDLVLSNNAPPLDLLKLSTPTPFRLPWIYGELGEWQIAYTVAHLGDAAPIPHAVLSGLRITWQPAAYVQFGFTNAVEAYGEGGVPVDALDFLPTLFIPSLAANPHTVNGVVAYDLVLSLPWLRHFPVLKGVKFYWQRGQDNTSNTDGLLGGGNIIGGVLEGGRWDLRVEFAETRDRGAIWYTHPTYQNGWAFDQFFLGHPIGGAAESLFARGTYYLIPTLWMAIDGRREQYGFTVQPQVTTQQRVGLEGSYTFPLRQRHLTLWGRFEYAALDPPGSPSQQAFLLHLAARWRF